MTYRLWPDLTESATFFGVETVNPRRSWYHEHLVGSKYLLVAVGDSWTWGDSLDRSPNENLSNDPDYRLPRTYGRLLSQMLGFDYCMLARCGGSNKEGHDRLKKFLPHVTDCYDRILVVATLTELGREFYDIEWPVGSDDPSFLRSVDDLLIPYEYRMMKHFQDLAQCYANVDFVMARNFTFTYESNTHLDHLYFIDKNWVQILAQHQNKPCYDQVRILSWMGFDPLISYLKAINVHDRLLPDIINMMELIQQAYDWLDSSDLNNKYASKHPNELGHQIWARYLWDEINKTALNNKYL